MASDLVCPKCGERNFYQDGIAHVEVSRRVDVEVRDGKVKLTPRHWDGDAGAYYDDVDLEGREDEVSCSRCEWYGKPEVAQDPAEALFTVGDSAQLPDGRTGTVTAIEPRRSAGGWYVHVNGESWPDYCVVRVEPVRGAA